MAKAKKEEEMIRVHNQGKRTIDYYPDPDTKKKKAKYILPGRAIEMKESIAKKYLKAYPRDLVEFDSLVSGDKKDLRKENTRLESENGSYLEKIEKLESENETLKEKVQKFESNVDPDVQALKDKLAAFEKELEEATKPDNNALKDSEQNLKDKTADKG